MGWMSAQVGEIREDFPFIGLLTLEFSHTMSPAFRESCSKSGAHSLGGPDGNRTRVRKAIRESISGCSLSTTFPQRQAGKQAAALVAS